jgi:hypothetical protein
MFTALTQARPSAACAVFFFLFLSNPESDHSPRTNAEIKDVWSSNTTPYSFMVCNWAS